MGKNYVHLNDPDNDFFYVALPKHPGRVTPGCVSKNVRLRDVFSEIGRDDLISMLGEADIILDIDKDNALIGIEILG